MSAPDPAATFTKVVAAEAAGPAPAFVRERLVLQAVSHPYVVTLLSAELHPDGTGLLHLERCPGPTLRELLRAPLPVDRTLDLARALFEALGAVHAAGFVHGDVKPDNVVAPPGAGCKLLDFGLSLPIGAAWHAEGAGTAAYMAPEQVRREQVTPATDIYAAGALLFELLTGQAPFAGTPAQLRQRALTSTPVPVSIVRGDERVPPPIEALVARMLDKAPHARPTLAECLRALGG